MAFTFYKGVFGTEFAGDGIMRMGDAVQIVLSPDTKDEADELYAELSDGGDALSPMADQFWGDYWGLLKDRFGVSWMVTVYAES